MRTIKFRGKNPATGEWVFGNYTQLKDEKGGLELNIVSREAESHPYKDRVDFTNTWYEVTPETVGQFTGLHDSKGNEVYEDDIVIYRTSDARFTKNPRFAVVKISFDETFAKFTYGNYWRDLYEEHIVEVIGNIHDNPELLNQEK